MATASYTSSGRGTEISWIISPLEGRLMNLPLQGKGMYEMTPAIMASIIPEAVVTDPGTISAAQVGTVHRQ